MKSRLLLAVLLLATVTTIGTSKENSVAPEADMARAEEERIRKLRGDAQSLVGLKSACVMVYFGKDARDAGFTQEQLKTELESKLRRAGIKVDTMEEYKESEEPVLLELVVEALSHSDHSCVNAKLSLWQSVYLKRKPGRMCRASTWSKSTMCTCGSDRSDTAIRQAVAHEVRSFIDDYLAANPKK